MNGRGGSISEVGINSLSTVDRSCEWKEFEEFFHDQFDQYFARSETRKQALQYVQSLLIDSDPKFNGKNPPAYKKITKSAQRLFFGAQWDDEAVHHSLQDFIVSKMGHEKGVCLIGVTYFSKKGDKTVGVQAQFNRKLKKDQNCQVCLFLGYSSPKGCTFLDRRLYLPLEWTEDQRRRVEAKIPENIEYRSKSDLALDMLQSVHAIGAPIRWVIGGEPFCSDTNLRNVIQAASMNYILSGRDTDSRFRSLNHRQTSPAPDGQKDDARDTSIFKIVSNWDENKWKRVIDNSNRDEICVFDWASDRVLEIQNEANIQEVWLLARRSVCQRCETAFFISNAAQETTLLNLAEKISDLRILDRMVSEASTNFMMDEYGVRHWNSWHRHITLSMIAHAWWVYKGKRTLR